MEPSAPMLSLDILSFFIASLDIESFFIVSFFILSLDMLSLDIEPLLMLSLLMVSAAYTLATPMARHRDSTVVASFFMVQFLLEIRLRMDAARAARWLSGCVHQLPPNQL